MLIIIKFDKKSWEIFYLKREKDKGKIIGLIIWYDKCIDMLK